MSKRKRVVLNFQQKLEILKQLNEGKSGSVLAKQYGIGSSTISDLRRNGDAILQFVSNLECENHISEKKTRKTVHNTVLDSKVYQWYNEEKAKGNSPPDAVICAKALAINKQLKGNENFKASSGWLRHFKNRHGIKEVKEQHEMDDKIKRQFLNVFKREGYIFENVYSADDCFLQWKSLPGCDNMGESCVSIIACTNINDSHKLPLCVLGQDKNTQINTETVIYKPYQNELAVFGEWFEDIFIPEVKKRQQLTRRVGKVLLVIDDAPCHPSKQCLIKNHDDFDIFIVSENFPEVLPLEYGIKQVKINYKRKLLNLLCDKFSFSIEEFQKEFSLDGAIRVMGEAWDSIPRSHILRFWGKLLPNVQIDQNHLPDQDISDFINLSQSVNGLKHCSEEDIRKWLEFDIDTSNILQEDNIKIEITTNDLEVASSEYGDDSQASIKTEPGPTDMEAYESLNTLIDWCTRQTECTNDHLVFLEDLRKLVASKMCDNVKQEY